MVFILLMFTVWHDTVLSISGIIGSFSIATLLVSLWKEKKLYLFFFGVISLILLMYNALSYFTFFHIETLPLIQKITLICMMLWFLILNVHYARKQTSA